MPYDNDAAPRLGSLAQHARRGSLKSAQSILIVVGALTLLIHAGLFFFAEKMVDDQIAKEVKAAGPGMFFDPADLKVLRDEQVMATKVACGVFAVVGLGFIILGLCVYKAPVACTVLGLLLYIGGWLMTIVLTALGGDHEDLGKAIVSGIVIKIFIIIALVKAVQAAVAYQKETATGT